MATNIDAPNICNSYNTHFQGLHKIHSIRWDKPIHLSNSWGMQNYKVDGVHLILPCKAQTLKKKKTEQRDDRFSKTWNISPLLSYLM